MSARNKYLEWARSPVSARERGKPTSFDMAELSGRAFELQELTGLRFDEAAWLAGITAMLSYSHHQLLKPDLPVPQAGFIYTWATLSPDTRNSGRVHINQRRFERWLNACTEHGRKSEWYSYTLEALKVVRGADFDIRTLYDIAALRCDPEAPVAGVNSLASRLALEFYSHQPHGLDGKAPRQIPTDELIGYQQ